MTDSFAAKVDDATTGVLSCLSRDLLGVGALCQASGLKGIDFPEPWGVAYDALMEAWTEGEEYDFLSLCNRMRMIGRLPDVSQLNERLTTFTPISSAGSHIATLQEARAARLLANLGERLRTQAFDATTDIQELLEVARKEVEKISVAPETQKTTIGHFAAQIVSDLEEPERHRQAEVIEIGLGLDDGAGPFERGDLIVIAGLTGGGKSALAGNIMENIGAGGRKGAIFSFEMTGKQNVGRMLASQSRVDIRELRKSLNEDKGLFDAADSREMWDLSRVRTAAAAMRHWKINVFEHLKSIEQVTAEIARGKFDVAMVDYAQLVRGLRSKGESREREVASISYELKQAGMKHDCLVILLSQLTVDDRTGSAHLRESRALGQDANTILFIEGTGDERVIRVGKARSAPPDTEIPILWEPQFTKFSEKSTAP